MANAQTSETTLLLRAWAEGDRAALERLTPRVYAELRRIAGYCMQNERPGRTLQTTALVHEAYLRLIDVTNVNWEHRAHFLPYRPRSCGAFWWMEHGRGQRPSAAVEYRASIWTKSRMSRPGGGTSS